MNLPCEIIEDLLPLFEDDVCSEESKRAVAAHLRKCETCRKLAEQTRNVVLEIPPEPPEADKAAARSFQKIRLRWIASLLLVIFMVPLCILGVGQLTGTGIHFTNLNELYIGNAFMGQLQQGNYEEAFQYIDINRHREDWLVEWSFDEETLANMDADGLVQFCKAASMLEAAGGIQEYRYIGIDKYDSSYDLFYNVLIDGKNHQMGLTVTDDGVLGFSCEGSFIDDPLAQLGMWNEYLWEYYAGCYWDPENGTYIYDNAN